MILGIDEVGRGAWAGPLVVGAVILGGQPIDGLTDSKKLTKKRRKELDKQIREHAAAHGLGWVHANELDSIGMAEALKVATIRAVEQIKMPYHEIIIDGTVNFLSDTSKGPYVTLMKKADLLIPSVSAASIIAKVARDKYMSEQANTYRSYKFASHVGYGTVAHQSIIDKMGVTPLHRLSFRPLQTYRTKRTGTTSHKLNKPITSTRKIGDAAETIAADYLIQQGHSILERNWKTKLCEIDIISQKANRLYFTEVKYRRKTNQGNGIDAITKKKLHRMQFGAKMYVEMKRLFRCDMILAVASLSGDKPSVDTWLVLD